MASSSPSFTLSNPLSDPFVIPVRVFPTPNGPQASCLLCPVTVCTGTQLRDHFRRGHHLNIRGLRDRLSEYWPAALYLEPYQLGSMSRQERDHRYGRHGAGKKVHGKNLVQSSGRPLPSGVPPAMPSGIVADPFLLPPNHPECPTFALRHAGYGRGGRVTGEVSLSYIGSGFARASARDSVVGNLELLVPPPEAFQD
jgi:hypothetical protein